VGKAHGHGNNAVYFDDGDGGDTVFGNVFFRCGEPGITRMGAIFSHGGHGNLAENNVFIECKRALGSSPWNDNRWQEWLEGPLWQTRLLKDVNITQPPYTTHYPELAGYMESYKQPRFNRAVRNVVVMCAEVSSGNWQVQNGYVTSTDPGFVDINKGQFALKPDSVVFREVPGFQIIPFDRIGLYKDALRPVLPVENWDYPPPQQLPPLPKRQ
jgi:hypothetical protein